MAAAESASFAPTADTFARTDAIKTLGNLFKIRATEAENVNSAWKRTHTRGSWKLNIQRVGDTPAKANNNNNNIRRKSAVYWAQLCSGTTTVLHILLWRQLWSTACSGTAARLESVRKSFLLLDDEWYWSERRSAWAPLETHTQTHHYRRWTMVIMIQHLGKKRAPNVPFDYR